MKTEFVKDMEWSEYTAGGFLGSSALSDWGSMGLEAWSAKHLENAYQGAGSTAAANGSAIDCRITGSPGDFAKKFVVKPKGMSFATKEGKLWHESFALPGVTVLDHESMQEILAAEEPARKALQHLGKVFGEASCQVTIRGIREDGIGLQTRPDFAFEAAHLVDLKYINSGNFDAFARHFVDGRYFLQSGLFKGLSAGPVRVSFLLVEAGTIFPRCKVIEVPEMVLQAGWDKCRTIAEEIATQKAEGFVDVPRFEVLELPGWAEAKIAA